MVISFTLCKLSKETKMISLTYVFYFDLYDLTKHLCVCKVSFKKWKFNILMPCSYFFNPFGFLVVSSKHADFT